MARTKKVNEGNKGTFRHHTSIGENGEILYDAPIEIKDEKDMANYHITNEDCRYIHFGASEKIRVYFYKTTCKEFAEGQWEYLNNEHSNGYYQRRCMVPGKYKDYVRCRDTNKCSECPYGVTEDNRQPSVISWNDLIDSGWEPAPEEATDQVVMAQIEYELMRAKMDAVDPNIAVVLEARYLLEDSVEEIAVKLGVSESWVYQLLAKGRKIAKKLERTMKNV